MVETAPVEDVGGVQQFGPWPESVDEIEVGETYQIPVQQDDGTVQDTEVTITGIHQIEGSDDGYAVSHQSGGGEA